MKNEVLEIQLICPICQHALVESHESLVCSACHAIYAVRDGVPILLRGDMSTFKRQELTYWDQRFASERAKGEQDFLYSEDRTQDNAWGLYRFTHHFDTLPKTARILEVGSGSAPVSLYYQLFHGFQQVITTDISVEAMITIKQYAQTHQIETDQHYFAAEMGYLPFADNTFDVVMTHAALHHAENVETAVEQMTRVLKPGGLLIIGHEPNTVNLKIIRFIVKGLKASEADVKESYSVADDEDQSFTRAQLKRLCHQAHIQIVEIRPVWFIAGVMFGLPYLMERVFKRQWKLTSKTMRIATRIDSVMGKLPFINRLCFHWSVVGTKMHTPHPSS